jgi:hypothetical protein
MRKIQESVGARCVRQIFSLSVHFAFLLLLSSQSHVHVPPVWVSSSPAPGALNSPTVWVFLGYLFLKTGRQRAYLWAFLVAGNLFFPAFLTVLTVILATASEMMVDLHHLDAGGYVDGLVSNSANAEKVCGRHLNLNFFFLPGVG